jgi:hypothetical protein
MDMLPVRCGSYTGLAMGLLKEGKAGISMPYLASLAFLCYKRIMDKYIYFLIY